MSSRLNVLLVGEESAGVRALRALARSGHRLVAVMASPLKRTEWGLSTCWDVAQQLGLPVWPAKLVKDPRLAHRIRSEQVDIILNVHSLFIIHADVLRAPRIGAFNMHPGPLPGYAGLNAPSWALYRGETSYGVTVHHMAPEIDTGPIAYQTLFPVGENETGLTLGSKCVKKGVPLVLELLKTASRDPSAIPAIEQDLSKREYFGREVPQNGCLSWAHRARRILNFVRACDYFPFPSPWGHPRVRLGDREIAIVKASATGNPADARPGTVGEPVGSGFPVACADEWILVSELMVEGCFKKPAVVLTPGDLLQDRVLEPQNLARSGCFGVPLHSPSA